MLEYEQLHANLVGLPPEKEYNYFSIKYGKFPIGTKEPYNHYGDQKQIKK